MRDDDEVGIRLQQLLHIDLGQRADLRQLFDRRIDLRDAGEEQPLPALHHACEAVPRLQLERDVERVVHEADDAFHLLRDHDAAAELIDDDAFPGGNVGGKSRGGDEKRKSDCEKQTNDFVFHANTSNI